MTTAGLQEQYLNAIRKNSIPATFYLVNGFQMKGLIKAFDNFTIVIESGGAQQMVFKHAISTIIPHTPINLSELG
ncbi:MAG: RNA chaperone Hfq [Clostridiales bacterium]